MLPRGIPETSDEAYGIVQAAADLTANAQNPSHYPHSQIISLSQVVVALAERVARLEAEILDHEYTEDEMAPVRRGRPPGSKNRLKIPA